MWAFGQPQYTVTYKYARWGNTRKIRAVVRLSNWGVLFIADRSTVREVYKAANRAIRAYTRYGNVNYRPANLSREMR